MGENTSGGTIGASGVEKPLTPENSVVRRSGERGSVDYGWTDAHFTFSFGEYYDPNFVGFRSLRVITENTIQGGGIFGAHPHSDMEIVTYVAEGVLVHEDSMGNGSRVRAGEFQRITAGTGIRHSEGNGSRTATAHIIQIWILPNERGLEPGYEQRRFPPGERQGKLRLAVSRDGRDGSLSIHQDAELWTAVLAPGEEARHEIVPGRGVWVHVVGGEIELNGTRLSAGDGAGIEGVDALRMKAASNADVLLFDLA